MKRKFSHLTILVIKYATIGSITTLAVSGILYGIFMLITDPTFRV